MPTYRNCTISYTPPPVPLRSCDWAWRAMDYRGAGDPRHGLAPTLEDAQQQIDAWYAAHEEPTCECVWEQGSWSVCALHRLPHSQHTIYSASCLQCEDAMSDARQVESEAPWNDPL